MLGEKLAPWSQVLRALGGLLEGEQRAARTGLIGVRMGRPLGNIIYIMRNAVSALARFVGSAWQWLGLWLGSCLRPGTPAKDEIAA